MTQQKQPIWQAGEYAYPMAAGTAPFLMTYIHSSPSPHPAVLVVPGGGYCFVSPTEAEPVAKVFYQAGYNAFVLTYTVNPLMNAPLNTQPLADISRAVRFIRAQAEDFRIDPGRLAVCGFSAGGHLCASLAVHWADVDDPSPAYAGIPNRPDAAILCYPVITSGPFAHRPSFQALLGEDASAGELAYMSLENHVTQATPPCFLWQTMEDDCVPVENSYLFAKALRAKGVPFAHHVFTKGPHGLSVANEEWLTGHVGEPYTTSQLAALRDLAQAGELPGVARDALDQFFAPPAAPDPAWRSAVESACRQAGIWPQLAIRWLGGIMDV